MSVAFVLFLLAIFFNPEGVKAVLLAPFKLLGAILAIPFRALNKVLDFINKPRGVPLGRATPEELAHRRLVDSMCGKWAYINPKVK